MGPKKEMSRSELRSVKLWGLWYGLILECLSTRGDSLFAEFEDCRAIV